MSFFVFFSFFQFRPDCVQQRYLTNGLSAHRHFSTKLMLIRARSSTTTQSQRLHNFKFTLVYKSHSQHSEAADRCGVLSLRTPFSNFVRMRKRSLVPRPKTTVIGLEARVHKRAGMTGTVFSSQRRCARLMNTT